MEEADGRRLEKTAMMEEDDSGVLGQRWKETMAMEEDNYGRKTTAEAEDDSWRGDGWRGRQQKRTMAKEDDGTGGSSQWWKKGYRMVEEDTMEKEKTAEEDKDTQKPGNLPLLTEVEQDAIKKLFQIINNINFWIR